MLINLNLRGAIGSNERVDLGGGCVGI